MDGVTKSNILEERSSGKAFVVVAVGFVAVAVNVESSSSSCRLRSFPHLILSRFRNHMTPYSMAKEVIEKEEGSRRNQQGSQVYTHSSAFFYVGLHFFQL